ncbi:putative phage abortive infection protein [Enterococcus casseliflavus]|uniref:putative phage abortive infection protein n=1 Tax=Enterococcus casseliflavus TaxID=37734 RepID=UPI001D1646D9|nr:putative phage abortive infection protein [Enterococcus casseliflavus]
MTWRKKIQQFDGWKWLIVGLVVGSLLSLIVLLFGNKLGEEWLGFIGGILGSIIGILGTFYVLNKQIKHDKQVSETQIQQDKEQNRKNQVDNTFFNLLDIHLNMKNKIEEVKTFESFHEDLKLEANRMIKSIGARKIIEANGIIDDLCAIFEAYIEKIKENLNELNIDTSGFPKENSRKLGYLINQLSENYKIYNSREEENDKRFSLVAGTLNEAASDVLKLIDMIRIGVYSPNLVPMFFKVFSSIVSNKIDTEVNKTLNELVNEVKKYHNKDGNYQLITTAREKQSIIYDVSQKHYSQLSSYLRLTNSILKYINENVDNSSERKNYLVFLRANMDENELLTLFYISTFGDPRNGLKKQLQNTDFFGIKEELVTDFDLAQPQHFNKHRLLWAEEDLKLMQCYSK